MNKFDYLKLALNNEKYKYKNWLITIFSVCITDEKEPKYLDIKSDQTGYYYYDNTSYIKIEGAKEGEPLFSHKDKITIDNTWCPNAQKTIETTIGNLIFNWVALVYAFGSKIEYAEGKVNLSKIEQQLAKMFSDEEETKSDNKIYPSEFNRYVEGLLLLSSLSTLFVWAATEKNLTSPPELEKQKKELVKEYGDRLKDPATFSEFEEKLKKIDEEYLKDDPSNGVILSGKTKNIARKRLALTAGIEGGINPSDSDPIIDSLNEGWKKDANELVARLNVSRASSYSRGKETEKGGEVQKIILRTASNFKIKGDNCLSKKGITRLITKEMKNSFIKRYIIGYLDDSNNEVLFKGEPILLTEENYDEYLNKVVIMRTVGYCLNEGDTVCKTCAGSSYNDGESTTLTLTDISHMILMSRMKVMHGVVLSTKKLILKEVIS